MDSMTSLSLLPQGCDSHLVLQNHIGATRLTRERSNNLNIQHSHPNLITDLTPDESWEALPVSNEAACIRLGAQRTQ